MWHLMLDVYWCVILVYVENYIKYLLVDHIYIVREDYGIRDIQITGSRILLFIFSSFFFWSHVPQTHGTFSWCTRGEGWGVVSLNICCREANMRYDNKISRQCICVSAWSCSNRICVVSSRISIVYIDVFCLHFALIQVTTNPIRLMSALVIVAWFFLLLALVCTSILNV
jgi:hypothetical protein